MHLSPALKTPIGFFIFNRPELTEQVFHSIAAQRPSKLLVVADGPRSGKIGEVEKCEQTRAILSKIDWECELLTNFSEDNLGCKNRLTTGLDWVFENVQEAIILEDDCIPDPSFFMFCQELLEKYRDDQRIVHISGANFQNGVNRGDYSYYFSKINYVWGWASWRRAWKKHDVDLKLWPEIKNDGLLNDMGDAKFVQFWTERFEEVFQKKIDTWDYQWVFTGWINGGLSIVPNVNLVKNVGFGPEATHTRNSSDARSNSTVSEIKLPLRHPPYVIRNPSADAYDMITRYPPPPPPPPPLSVKRVIRRVARFLRDWQL